MFKVKVLVPQRQFCSCIVCTVYVLCSKINQYYTIMMPTFITVTKCSIKPLIKKCVSVCIDPFVFANSYSGWNLSLEPAN